MRREPFLDPMTDAVAAIMADVRAEIAGRVGKRGQAERLGGLASRREHRQTRIERLTSTAAVKAWRVTEDELSSSLSPADLSLSREAICRQTVERPKDDREPQ